MTPKEAFEILRDTPIDIRSAREDDIHSLYATAQNMALDALQKQMWIPCSERLPEEDGNYLVSGVWGSGKEAVGECDFSVNDGYFRTAWNFDVIAWMPLPEPYKEETDGRAD